MSRGPDAGQVRTDLPARAADGVALDAHHVGPAEDRLAARRVALGGHVGDHCFQSLGVEDFRPERQPAGLGQRLGQAGGLPAAGADGPHADAGHVGGEFPRGHRLRQGRRAALALEERREDVFRADAVFEGE